MNHFFYTAYNSIPDTFYVLLWHTRRTHPQPCPDSMGTRLATLQSVPSAPLGSPCPEAPHRAPAPSD